MKNYEKYSIGYFTPPEPCHSWVKKDHIEKAPKWCSVDLRDGNQALIVPMSLEEKVKFTELLLKIGFKEIEVGFPAASETEYKFMRTLIEDNIIPEDVTLQVLTQSREHIIKKTFEAIKGIKNVIVHLYNSTSVAQREQVFKKNKEEIIKIAVEGAKLFNKYAEEMPETHFTFEYSPESFTGTEPEFALEICNAVIDVWQPSPERQVIINLPSTVSMSLPHVYANQIEYIHHNLHYRENVIISLHPHNDRGTAVAEAELGILAGADRVEGTLFGNGERTGNVDIVTLAMNLYSHGVNPELDFSDMQRIVKAYEELTDMKVHPRQPYGGQLVFAAFSGSHQDAIAKGMKWRQEKNLTRWTVPYLPIDPTDVGRQYEADVVRINSQSGKGGVAYVLENNFGYIIPVKMREELGYLIKGVSDHQHKELMPEEILDIFKKEYTNRTDSLVITDAVFTKAMDSQDENRMEVQLKLNILGNVYDLSAKGNGSLDAVSNAIRQSPYPFEYNFVTYSEHALETNSNSQAIAYVAISDSSNKTYWGVGIDKDIIYASINALVSALNRKNHIKEFIK